MNIHFANQQDRVLCVQIHTVALRSAEGSAKIPATATPSDAFIRTRQHGSFNRCLQGNLVHF